MKEYRAIEAEELTAGLFRDFCRHQEVTKCWRKIDGKWCVQDIAFVEEWGKEDYEELAGTLRAAVLKGGVVYGAFVGQRLKGFAAVSAGLFGAGKEYLELSNLYVSEEFRGQGIGAELFGMAGGWAESHGAGKLYISAHSSVESQAFYRKMGCVEAEEYSPRHVEKEPCDCQLEYVLQNI